MNKENKPKMFSLNKVTYMISHDMKPSDSGVEEKWNEEKGRMEYNVWYVFPETKEVRQLIKAYYQDEKVNTFIRAYNDVIKMSKDIKLEYLRNKNKGVS